MSQGVSVETARNVRALALRSWRHSLGEFIHRSGRTVAELQQHDSPYRAYSSQIAFLDRMSDQEFACWLTTLRQNFENLKRDRRLSSEQKVAALEGIYRDLLGYCPILGLLDWGKPLAEMIARVYSERSEQHSYFSF